MMLILIEMMLACVEINTVSLESSW